MSKRVSLPVQRQEPCGLVCAAMTCPTRIHIQVEGGMATVTEMRGRGGVAGAFLQDAAAWVPMGAMQEQAERRAREAAVAEMEARLRGEGSTINREGLKQGARGMAVDAAMVGGAAAGMYTPFQSKRDKEFFSLAKRSPCVSAAIQYRRCFKVRTPNKRSAFWTDCD